MAEYHLALSDDELDRYRRMAGYAAEDEQLDLAAAGVVPGARVADVGCGPGAMTAVLADRVAPGGQVDGVDGDEGAIAHAVEAVAGRGATATVGRADATGLPLGSYDVVMCRHVLAHNGGHEQQIVDHLTALARPGGAVYLVDVDLTSSQFFPPDPERVLAERYADFHAAQGNDPRAGLRLGEWLEAAGCTVERYHAIGRVQRVPLGLRGPTWAAREAMVASGIVTEQDVARTGAAFDRIEASGVRPWLAIASYVAVGRVPG
jgi:SAM-dependent methyltransferase